MSQKPRVHCDLIASFWLPWPLRLTIRILRPYQIALLSSWRGQAVIPVPRQLLWPYLTHLSYLRRISQSATRWRSFLWDCHCQPLRFDNRIQNFLGCFITAKSGWNIAVRHRGLLIHLQVKCPLGPSWANGFVFVAFLQSTSSFRFLSNSHMRLNPKQCLVWLSGPLPFVITSHVLTTSKVLHANETRLDASLLQLRSHPEWVSLAVFPKRGLSGVIASSLLTMWRGLL